MKTLYILLLAFIITFTVACDKIESPYVNLPEVVDTAACPVPDFPSPATPVRKVLLEDYTGHTCPNCPTAAVTAKDLSDQYPGQVILMAVHAGWFARTYPEAGVPQIFDYDFRTPAGTDWDAYFGNGNAGNPNGLVNRLKVNNKYVLRPNEWGSVINTELMEEPALDIQLIVDYSAVDRKICAHSKIWFVDNLDLNLKLSIVVIEDGIIAAQKNNDPAVGIVGDIEDYVHNHVIRGALNGTWGSSIAEAGVQNPESLIKTVQSVLPLNCIPENCHIIAFVADADSKEVLAVAEAKLVE